MWSTAAKTLLDGERSFSLKTPATKPTEAGASGSEEWNTWSVRCDWRALLWETERPDARVFLHEVAAGLHVEVGRDDDFQLPETTLQVRVDAGEPRPCSVAERLLLLPREEGAPGEDVGRWGVSEIDAHLGVLQGVFDLDLQRTVLVGAVPHFAVCGRNGVCGKVARTVDRRNGWLCSLFLVSTD